METRTADEIEESTHKLLRELRAVVEDGENLLRSRSFGSGEAGQMAREKLSHAIETAKETSRRLERKAVAGAKQADRLIREYPYQSLGIALGAGLLIGVLLNRK